MSTKRKHPKYEEITSRWGGMDVRHEFSKRIDIWLSAFDEAQRPLLLTLLGEFYYYSEKQLTKKAKELKAAFDKEYVGDDSLIFTTVIKEYGTSFSDLFWNTFWFANDLYDLSEKNIIGLLSNNQIPTHLVIIDDYSGTGGTFVKTLQTLIETNAAIIDSHIYLLSIHITERATALINQFSAEVGIDITIIALDKSAETFREGTLFQLVEAEKKRLSYEQICAHKHITMALGFEDVQSLVAFHYNTPNNTLGLFWQDLEGFAALFPRKKKARTTLSEMQKRAKTNSKIRKQPPVLYNIDEIPLAFMAYCLAQGNSFSFEKAKVDFGLTDEQLHHRIGMMVDCGYIENKSGRFCATPKLSSKMFKSRVKPLKKLYDETPSIEKITFNADDKYIPKNF